jgi:hypothetical protein
MASSSLLHDVPDVIAAVGATDVLVYRRAVGGRFVLSAPVQHWAAEELLVDDEPAVAAALRHGVHRIAAEQPRAVCAGYVARAAAVIAIDRDVVVVLGRRDGCLAGVADAELVAAAEAAANAV